MSHPIVVEGVSKRFRLQADRPTSVKEMFTRRDRDKAETHFWALRDVNIEIAEGSMYALIGHNGCGKSTLLRCIAGIYRPDEGHVRVSGRISTLLELGAGFHPDLSGRENVYLNATILGMSKQEIDAAFDDIVDFAGDKIGQFIDSPVKVYSTGMYVRLGFSVAVHVRPEILIIDEVIAVGDEQFQRQCFDHLYKLRKDGTTIVVVTHGLGIVQTMCDGAAWLDHGVLQESGDAPAVARSYLRRVNQAEADKADLANAGRAAADLAPTDAGLTDVDGNPLTSASVATAAPARPRITPDGEHWGGGEVRVTNVEFLDADNTPVSAVGERSPLRIRISYETDGTYTEPTFGIAIHNESGLHITGTNTRLSGRSTGTIHSTGHVEYTTELLPLLAGMYEISVAIEDQFSQHTFDRYDRGWVLRVRHDGEQAVHGMVDIGGDWRVDGSSPH